MANTKNSDLRLGIIDRCLRRGWLSTSQIMEIVNSSLEGRMLPKVESLNTIRADLNYIIDNYPQVEVEVKRKGRKVSYRYKNREQSIYKLMLKEDEMIQVSQCMALLAEFEGLMPNVDWIESFINRFKESLAIDPDATKKVVGLDHNPNLKGLEHFGPLLAAVTDKKVIELTYTSFLRGHHTYIFHPYYLKEYNNRWFIIGNIEGRKDLTNFALDRIDNFSICDTKKYNPLTIDLNEKYFSDIVGVSRPTNTEISTVKLWVSSRETPYMQTKPIHKSQVLTLNPDGSSNVTLKLYINYELENILLSYSDGIKVLEPAELVTKIKNRLITALKAYE